MDDIDRKILILLQQDASIPMADLAKRVGLSTTPCWKRVQRMQDTGVILGRIALVAPEKIGLGLTVFVEIQTGDHSAQWLKEFKPIVSAMPEVMDFYRMAGEVDYILRVVVADMEAYDAFYKKLITSLKLKNVTSRFSMERIKAKTSYQIPAAPKSK